MKILFDSESTCGSMVCRSSELFVITRACNAMAIVRVEQDLETFTVWVLVSSNPFTDVGETQMFSLPAAFVDHESEF